jgi:hypothetical protein
MASERSLSDLLIATREEVMLLGTGIPFRDGDSTDPYSSAAPTVSLTRCINKAIAELARAGQIATTTFTLAINNADNEYALDNEAGRVLTVHFGNKRLRQLSLEELNARYPDWATRTASVPTAYAIHGSRIIVTPRASAGGTLTYIAESYIPDLALLASVPTNLPVEFHDLIPVGAAVIIAQMDMGNENAQRRLEPLLKRWEEGKARFIELCEQRTKAQASSDAPLTLAAARQKRLAVTQTALQMALAERGR